jgi:hypothetical protein
MPSEIRDPKALTDWVELDYHMRSRGMCRWRGKLTKWVFVGLLLLVGASVAASLTMRRTSTVYQAGPLAPAHSMFQNDCARCHTAPFTTALRFSPGHAHAPTVPDAACSSCHDGPTHNALLIDEPHCAECHREHRGRTFLSRVPDLDCTDCHENLKSRHKQPDKCRFDNVTSFPSGHPEFALWRGTDPKFPESKDPGKLRFNHKLHLDPAGVFVPERGKPQSMQREVLQCASCHQADDGGRYMKPIRHEAHCARCHDGQRSIRLAGTFLGADLDKAADAFAAEPAPHLPPKDIRDRLNGRLLEFLGKNPVDTASGENLERPWVRPKSELVWQPLIDRPLASFHRERFIPPQIAQMERMLYDQQGGCRYCHLASPEKIERDVSWEKPRPTDRLPDFLATKMPDRWFQQASFNHQHHRVLNCVECHAAIDSTKTDDVLMPKRDLCAQCHSPAGNARFDCAECHKYHDRVAHPEKQRNNAIGDLLKR